MPAASTLPLLGHGIGLRTPHYQHALAGELQVDWVEVITENFLGPGGRPRAALEAVRREMPVVFHGVSLSIGGSDPLDERYLAAVRALADQVEPAWISDHLCWGAFGGHHTHDLMPLPMTEAAVEHVVARIDKVQARLGRRLVLENVSSYLTFQASEMPEWAFLAEVVKRADCLVLLDLNNIIVNATNAGYAPLDFLDGLEAAGVADRVVQFHLANHTLRPDGLRFDDHRGPVPDEVWSLYRTALTRFGPVSSLIEWDDEIPTLARLEQEQQTARRIADEVLS